MSRRVSAAVVVSLATLGATFFALPLSGLILRAPWAEVPRILASTTVFSALKLSLISSLSATLLSVVFGVPLAWLLARVPFPGRRLLRALVTLPLVLPPVVGGVALLLVLGRLGFVGRWLDATFVAMPFLVLAVQAALESQDRRFEDASATLGASPWTTFRRVTLPLLGPSLGAGAVLAWARALGEFGATITFAGNSPGRTQTIPIAVYVELLSDVEGAIVLSLVLVAVSLVVLVGLRDRWLTGA
jgi:molybdate transport system permease protein